MRYGAFQPKIYITYNKTKMKNAIFNKWMRRLSSIVAVMLLTVSFSQGASARILFQDDVFHDVASEGLRINDDDAGDEDVTIQLGNDGTDGTIIWDDGTSTLTVGDGTDSVAVDSGTWDISGAGVASGFTGITSTGAINFSGASRLALHQGGANPATCTEGDIFYNTTDNTTYICTATNTWTALSTGGADTFESVYAADGDNTLTTTNGDFTVNTGTGDFIVTSNDWSVNATGDLTANNVTSNGTLDANGVVTLGDGGDSITIDSSTWDISAAGAASGFTTISASGNVTTSGGDFIIGTTGLTETTANNDSGAFLVGIFDEFDNSNGTNVQDVVDDIDAAIGTRSYTEDNVLTDGQSVTASLDALDQKWGDLASTANGEGASLVGIEDTAGYFTGTNLETVFAEIGSQIGANADNVDEMTFEPEYPNAVIFEDGSNNKGKVEALYDNTNREHYYRWTSQQNSSNDIDIRFRYELPADFASVGNLTYRLRTDTTTGGDNSAAVIIRNDTDDATCHSDGAVTGAAAGTWETVTITAGEINTGCAAGAALAAGDIIEIQIKMAADNTSSGGTDVGTLTLDYNN